MARLSAKFGPFRLNVSTSGISYSFGVKGARINTGPRGTFVTFSTHGVTYRRKISRVPDQPHHYISPGDDKRNLSHTITSAPVDQITDAESKDFIEELTEKSGKLSYTKWIGIPLTLAYILFLYIHYQQDNRIVNTKSYFLKITSADVNLRQQPTPKGNSLALLADQTQLGLLDSTNSQWYKVKYQDSVGYISRKYAALDSAITDSHTYTLLDDQPQSFLTYLFLGLIAGIFLCLYLRRKDKKRLLIEIYYEMDDKIQKVHERFIQHFSEVISSARIWQYLHEQHTYDQKRNAGTSNLITRIGVKSIRPDKKPERFFQTNISIPNIQLRNSDLYFFPERLVIKRGNTFGAVFYNHLNITAASTRFIEEGIVPHDAEIVDKTWRFLNKNGTPDRRFNNNRQLPICLYSQYHFSSSSGINETFTTSRKGAFDNFAHFLTAIGHLQDRMVLQ